MGRTFDGIIVSHRLRDVNHELPQLDLAAALEVSGNRQVDKRHDVERKFVIS